MRARLLALAVLASLFPAVAHAESFRIEVKAETPLAPAQAYRAFTRVDRWWNPSHTYSGDAGNLRLEARPSGCWCERLPGGGFVEHMRVIYADPGKTLRLSGGLGPLQAMPANGVMTVTFAAGPEGGATATLSYAVDGPGVAALEGPVKAVLTEQWGRFAALR